MELIEYEYKYKNGANNKNLKTILYYHELIRKRECGSRNYPDQDVFVFEVTENLSPSGRSRQGRNENEMEVWILLRARRHSCPE